MNVLSRKKIVILGMMTRMPVAGNIWLVVQYMIGLRRLGYEPYYVEAHAVYPGMLMGPNASESMHRITTFMNDVLGRFGFKDNWAFHALHADGECLGMSERQLRELYRSAEVIFNLHGGTVPLPEHSATGRLVYVGTDPVQVEVELHDRRQETIDFLAPHSVFFTWGENYGNPDCRVPWSDQFRFMPTRAPVVLDLWEPSNGAPARVFTTIGNWNQNRNHKDVVFQGERYTWSKHFEFLKFLDLPQRTPQEFELALSSRSHTEEDRLMLESKGWRVRDALTFSTDLDDYRRYIQHSRGEFTVAKDQNVRLRSGWFSERSAQYLAAGRPVITQETGFSNILPTGEGLFGFSTLDEAAAAVEAVNADYPRHCRAAREIAHEYFRDDRVLKEMLDQVGAGSGLSTARRKSAERGIDVASTQDDLVVLISCLGDDDTGGGLFALDGDVLERIDNLSTTGMCVAGNRLVRMLRSDPERNGAGELLVYDEHGVRQYLRIDNLADAHDVAWDGANFVVVSTSTNSIIWITPSGEILRTWKAPGVGDAWHLNSLLFHDGRILASAFGRFDKHREWTSRKHEPAGIVLDVAANSDFISGLSLPHHPRIIEEACLVCNSGKNELVLIDPASGTLRRSLKLEGFTRGLAVTDDFLFVGESADRGNTRLDICARLVVVCRKSWKVLLRLPLPCREIYDIILAPRSLLRGVKRGFRTNPQRTAEQDQYALFRQAGVEPVRLWATGDPLPFEACRVRVHADLPSELDTDAVAALETTIENVGGAIYCSAPPHPVHLSYRWLCAETRTPVRGVEGLRTLLPRSLPPRIPITCTMRVQAPKVPGRYCLRVTLVQEHVAWFDDLDPSNYCERIVEVRGADIADVTPLGNVTLIEVREREDAKSLTQ